MKYSLLLLQAILIVFLSCNEGTDPDNTSSDETVDSSAIADKAESDPIQYDDEVHLMNVRQLTFGGENAEAYFSFDESMLVFQRTKKDEGIDCDQIYYSKIPAEGENFEFNLVSTGTGRTTCAYFLKDDSEIVFASTHLSSGECPEVPDREKLKKYVWPIYSSYEIFISDKEGNIKKQLTDNEFYDAEATVSPDGSMMVFTSTRTGDLELFTMDIDGSNVIQVTSGLGYDGGAFFSPDGKKLVFRASRPTSEEDVTEYKELLLQGLVAPTYMEVYTCNIDGSDLEQITNLGQANWAPYFHPSGKKIIFSSNHQAERGFPFNLYLINIDGTGLEQVTHDGIFDAFAMFSKDGKHLVFSSNRNNGGTRDTNIFMADWVD